MPSVFAGVTRGEREFDEDIATTRLRNHWIAIGKKLAGGEHLAALEKSDRDELRSARPGAEKALLATEAQWHEQARERLLALGVKTRARSR